jgi:cobalt-zinc-cadmium efflux system membrane fusion protein
MKWYGWLAILVLLVACDRQQDKDPQQQAGEGEAASSSTAWHPVRPADEAELWRAPAQVVTSPNAESLVSPPLAGRLVALKVTPGDQVEAGTVLAELVSPELASAAAQLSSSASIVKNRRARVEQLRKLLAEGLTRQAELTAAEGELAEASRIRNEAQAVLRAAGFGPGQAARLARNGGRIPLRAPTSGVVLEVKAVLGQSVQPGGTPLVHIAAKSGRRVEAHLAAAMPDGAEAFFVDGNGRRTALQLVSRSPRVDSADGTTRHWFELPEDDARPPGELGVVHVVPKAADDVYVVPASAVAGTAAKPHVVVRRAGKPQRVQVATVMSAGSVVMVRGALQRGDEVAVTPQSVLVP